MNNLMSEALLDLLVCPLSGEKLYKDADGLYLVTLSGSYKYPIVDGIPTLISEFKQEVTA